MWTFIFIILLIVIGTFYFRYVAAGTKYDGDVAHNVKAAAAFIDCMTPQDVIYILSPQ
jgi:hypothetical protein